MSPTLTIQLDDGTLGELERCLVAVNGSMAACSSVRYHFYKTPKCQRTKSVVQVKLKKHLGTYIVGSVAAQTQQAPLSIRSVLESTRLKNVVRHTWTGQRRT